MHCWPERPPLGPQLYEKLRERPNSIIQRFPALIRRSFEKRFEEGMVDLYEHSTSEAFAFVREMCIYFSWFETRPGNVYIDLIQFLIAQDRPFALATTNYDLLLEHAILSMGYKCDYRPLAIWKNCVHVLKIHGSCNFVPDMRGIIFDECYFDQGGKLVDMSLIEGLPISGVDPYEVRRFCTEQNSIAPSIALYTPGKQVKFFAKPVRAQLRRWQEMAVKTDANYVIGLRVEKTDSHIWDYLAKSTGKFVYVGVKKDFDDWTGDLQKQDAFYLGSEFDKTLQAIKDHLNEG